MSAALRDALREQFDYWTVALGFAVLVVLNLLFDTPPAQLAMTAVTLAIGGVSEAATDAYDLRDDVRHLGFGLIALVGTLGLLVLGEGSVAAPLVLAALGGWVLLDSVQTLRHRGFREHDDDRDGRAVYLEYVTRRVHETLKERPRTRRELEDALDADEAAIDVAVTRLRERDVIVERGSELRTVDDETGRLAEAAADVRAVAARIARPVTIEFGTAGGPESDIDDRLPDEKPASDAQRATHADESVGRANCDGQTLDSNGEPERERSSER